MEKYDVVIVGAGPGGLQAAKVLAENDKKVLVLEKNKKIERKICTGMWPLIERTEYFGLPDKIIDNKFKKVLIGIPGKEEYIKLKKPFVATLDRKKLSKWMVKEATKAGAIVKFDKCVNSVEKNFVIVNKKKIYFNNLIGADGSSSIVRRYLGLENEEIGLGIQYWVNQKSKDLELHFDADKFGPWYLFKAPHKKMTAVGTAAHPGYLPITTSKPNLEDWCKAHDMNFEDAVFEGAPINFYYKGHDFGNIHLIGDAAGIASSFSGEGISFAMCFGEDVARQIIDTKYEPKHVSQILEIKNKHDLIEKSFRLNKTLEKIEYNILLDLVKLNLFEKELVDLFV